MRAVRALGHPCRLVDVVGWYRRSAGWPMRAWCDWSKASARLPSFFTRHAHALEPERWPSADRRTGGRRLVLRLRTLARPAPRARARGRTALRHLPRRSTATAGGVPQVLFLPKAWIRPRLSGHPRPCDLCDLSFVGSGQYPHRHELLRASPSVGRLQIRGPGWDGATIFPSPADRSGARVSRGGRRRGHLRRRPRRGRPGAAIRLRLEPDLEGARLRRVLPGPLAAGSDDFARNGEHCAWYRDLDEAVAARRALPGCARRSGPVSRRPAGSTR